MVKEQLIKGINDGDLRTLSKAITLAESSVQEKHNLALDIIEHFGPQTDTFRIGITGTPGVGKSTFIDAAGKQIAKDSKKLAVLSIDPSSSITGGSILGDKTRMSALTSMENVYIRPTASGSQLGGLARNTRLAMLLCEAAGYKNIIIESVGVGQGETEIKQLSDLFVLLINPGAGDELQGIKRGIMEVADILLVNKADGDLPNIARQTAKEYSMALHHKPDSTKQWNPKTLITSATENIGINKFWETASDYHKTIVGNGWKSENRTKQMSYWANKNLQLYILQRIDNYNAEVTELVGKGELPEKIALKLFNKNFN